MQEQQFKEEEAFQFFTIHHFLDLYRYNNTQLVHDLVNQDRDTCINLMMDLEKEIRQT